MKNDWSKVGARHQKLLNTMARRQRIKAVMEEEVPEGYVYDPMKKVTLVIADCKDSTLRRISKSLNAMYNSADPMNSNIKNILKNKRVELLKELESRE